MGVPNEKALVVVGFFFAAVYIVIFLFKLYHTFTTVNWRDMWHSVVVRDSGYQPIHTNNKKKSSSFPKIDSGGIFGQREKRENEKGGVGGVVNKYTDSSGDIGWKDVETDDSFRNNQHSVLYASDNDLSYLRNYQLIVFDICFLFGLVLRSAYFCIVSLESMDCLWMSDALIFLVNTTPSFLFFTNYTILLTLWIRIYENSYVNNSFTWGSVDPNKSQTQQKRANIIVNGFVYGTAIIIYALDMHSSGLSVASKTPETSHENVSGIDSAYEKTIIIFVSLLYILIDIVFFFYSYHIYRNRLYFTLEPSDRNQVVLSFLRKIGLFVFLCMIIFLIRAVLNLLQLVVNINGIWWIILLYYAVLEVLPLSIMLIVIVAASSNPLVSF